MKETGLGVTRTSLSCTLLLFSSSSSCLSFNLGLLPSDQRHALLTHPSLLARPLALAHTQTLCPSAFLHLDLFDALSLVQGLLVVVVEYKGTVWGKAVVKVLILDLCDAWVVVAVDLDALES